MIVPTEMLSYTMSALAVCSRDLLTLFSTEKVLTVASFDRDPSREFALDPHQQSQGAYLAVISTSPKCNRCQLLASSQVTWLTSSGTFERPSATFPSGILYGPAFSPGNITPRHLQASQSSSHSESAQPALCPEPLCGPVGWGAVEGNFFSRGRDVLLLPSERGHLPG